MICCWMNMFKSVVLLKGIHLETVPETQGPIKELTCSLCSLFEECQNGEPGQPKMQGTM